MLKPKSQVGTYTPKPKMVLPVAKTIPPKDISGYSIFLYGKQKTGKTSLTAQLPSTLHFFFEPSGTDYELFAVEPKNWDEFVGFIDTLEKGEHEFKTFVLDVVDLAYEMCMTHLLTLQGMTKPSESPYGAIYGEVKTEFRKQMQRLAFLGGLVCVSHAKEKRIESRKGDYDLIAPTAANGCTEIISKWADLTAYYAVDADGSRKLHISPSVEYEAGNRMETRFKNKSDGRPLEFIPMGRTSKEAFENFMKAFRNELEVASPKEETSEEEVAQPPKKKIGLKK